VSSDQCRQEVKNAQQNLVVDVCFKVKYAAELLATRRGDEKKECRYKEA
jgi:hypothetical protein